MEEPKKNFRIVSDKKLIKTFADQILVPKIMDDHKNDFFGMHNNDYIVMIKQC